MNYIQKLCRTDLKKLKKPERALAIFILMLPTLVFIAILTWVAFRYNQWQGYILLGSISTALLTGYWKVIDYAFIRGRVI